MPSNTHAFGWDLPFTPEQLEQIARAAWQAHTGIEWKVLPEYIRERELQVCRDACLTRELSSPLERAYYAAYEEFKKELTRVVSTDANHANEREEEQKKNG